MMTEATTAQQILDPRRQHNVISSLQFTTKASILMLREAGTISGSAIVALFFGALDEASVVDGDQYDQR